MKKSDSTAGPSPSALIDGRIAELADWRGNTRRAIDIHEGEEVDADAFKALINAAIALNTAKGKKSR